MRGQKQIPLRVALFYALFAGLWVLLSDRALVALVTDPALLTTFQTAKGWFFVVISAIFLYALLRYELQARVRAESDYLDSERRFRQLLERDADGIVIVDQDGVVRFANPAAEKLFGRSMIQLMGKPFGFPVVAGEKADLDIIRPGVVTAIAEMRVVETVWEGSPTYLAALRDITDRKQAETALRELTLLREAERMQQEFVSNVSHELRTPLSVLTMLSGNLDTLYERLDEQKRRNLVHEIREYVRLLNDLIAGVLEISRIDSGRAAMERQTLDLAQLAREEADKQLPLAKKKKQSLQVIGVEQVMSTGNEVQIRQIIRNLVNNAIKYTPAGGKIVCECRVFEPGIAYPELDEGVASGNEELDAERQPPHPVSMWPGRDQLSPDPWVALRVSDTGIGISTVDQQRIFERFYRVETQSNIAGTGLGLAIVWELVKLHGGAVAVASRPGQGSSFAVYLPPATVQVSMQRHEAATYTDSPE